MFDISNVIVVNAQQNSDFEDFKYNVITSFGIESPFSEKEFLEKDANLLTIPDIKSRFEVKVGLSDHTIGIEGPVVAAALGATVIEKHFILDKAIGGPDAHFSLDEKEFTEMVNAVRKAEEMIGEVDYKMTEKKKKSRQFSRSLYIVEDVKSGDIITEVNMRSIRPGNGMHPKYYNEILGKKFLHDIKRGTPLSFNLIE